MYEQTKPYLYKGQTIWNYQKVSLFNFQVIRLRSYCQI